MYLYSLLLHMNVLFPQSFLLMKLFNPLSCLSSFFKDQVIILIDLIVYYSPILHTLDYCTFIVSLEVINHQSSNFDLLQYYVGYAGSLASHVNFRSVYLWNNLLRFWLGFHQIYKLIGEEPSSWKYCLPIHEYWLSLHLTYYSLISFIGIL